MRGDRAGVDLKRAPDLFKVFQRVGDNGDAAPRCHQEGGKEGNFRNHHQGRTKGPKEEITRQIFILSPVTNLRLSFIKLNFYFHRKEFRRKKLSLEKNCRHFEKKFLLSKISF